MELHHIFGGALALALGAYTVFGVENRVEEIKQLAPEAIEARGWSILRYDGYQRGAWFNHGGKVWYHVKDNKIKNNYYKVYLTLWNGEVHFYYQEPEKLQRIGIDATYAL